MKKFFRKLWLCKVWKWHDWTSAADQGIPPTPKQLADGVPGFWDYAKVWCRRCGEENRSSVESRERAKTEADKEKVDVASPLTRVGRTRHG